VGLSAAVVSHARRHIATLTLVRGRTLFKPQVAIQRDVWLHRNTISLGTDAVKGIRVLSPTAWIDY
jgi:hypothetical protein